MIVSKDVITPPEAIVSKDVITPPEANKEELTFEESCISEREHLLELEIEEDEEGISDDHHAIGNCIEQWIQVSTSSNQFCFSFYFINLHFQHFFYH